MPGRIEIRSTVDERPVRRAAGPLNLGPGSSLPFLVRLILLAGAAVATGLAMVGSVTQAMKVGITGLLLDGMLALPAVVLCLVLLGLTRRRRQASLVVGADGVQVRRFGGTRFIPHSRIRGIRRQGRHLVLDERGRPPLLLLVRPETPAGRGPERESATLVQLDQLIERMEQARAGYGKASSLAALEALVAGARQVTTAWLGQVRGATRREGYREEPLSVESLWPIVEDASMPARERLAAAVALRAELDEAGRSRLRVAVDSTLSPRVRVALEAALDEDDAQLATSFAELTEERGDTVHR